jgi:iron(III) transport system substrate-binding protein
MAKRSITAAIAVAAALALLTGCSSAATPAATAKTVSDPALASLIKAAQKEGSLTFYSVPPEATAQALADKFKADYGIEAKFVRGTAGTLATRISSEATAGALAADMVMISDSDFVTQAIDKKWLETPKAADLPGYPWSIPKGSLHDDGNVTIQYAPSGFSYNTDVVSKSDVPKVWDDLLKPMFKGKVLVPNPGSSPAAVEFWYMVEQKYGIDFLKKLAPQIPRFYDSVVPMTESLAAGEGAIGVPNVAAAVGPAAAKGAPVDIVYPDLTTGPEIVPLIANKAAHPNAAKLFSIFLMSKEGNAILNKDPGLVGPYDTDKLPKDWTRVDRDAAAAAKSEIMNALGAK